MRILIQAIFFAPAFLFANSIPIHTDYKNAYEEAAKTGKPLLLFIQKNGKPEVPSLERWKNELGRFTLLTVPTDYELADGTSLTAAASFRSLNGGAGVVRLDRLQGQLKPIAHLAGENISTEALLRRVLGIHRARALAAAMPVFASEEVNAIVEDPQTYWYDKATMEPVYQDGEGRYRGVLSLRAPYGSGSIFDHAGGKFSFPFGVTAGTDRSSNLHIANFLWRPRKNEETNVRWPVAVYTKERGANYVDMIYPRGAVVGEVLYLLTQDGTPYVVEVRTRRRELSYWSPNVYRPFREAEDLVQAIETHFPNWGSTPSLAKMVAHLKDQSTVQPLALRRSGVLNAIGGVDTLPPMEDAHVAQLLRNTVFKSCEGIHWKASQKRHLFAYAASGGKDPFHVFPQDYQAGAISVDSQSCAQCHDQSGRNIGAFGANPQQGEIWGFDGIFSFHPFRREVIVRSPSSWPHQPLRRDMLNAGLIALYDPAEHPASVYQVRVRDYQRRK